MIKKLNIIHNTLKFITTMKKSKIEDKNEINLFGISISITKQDIQKLCKKEHLFLNDIKLLAAIKLILTRNPKN